MNVKRSVGSLALFSAPVLFLVSSIDDASAGPQRETSTSQSEDVVVTGRREGMIDVVRLKRAQAVFLSGRDAFAPASVLLFELRPRDPSVLRGMTLTLRRGEQAVSIPIDAAGRFALPQPGEGRWELVHNRGKAMVAVRALVQSPDTSEADRRLGDLRLQCRVGWELKKQDYSLFARTGFSAMGGCSSSRFAFSFSSSRPLVVAIVEEGGRSMALPISAADQSYRAPLGANGWSNSARLRLKFLGP